MSDFAISIRAIESTDRHELIRIFHESWGESRIVRLEESFDLLSLAGFIAQQNERIVGVLTYVVDGDATEIISLEAVLGGRGVGRALIQRVCHEASLRGCQKVWLVTTNDNVKAIQFYQKAGFRLVKLYPGAVSRDRKLKPTIPLCGDNGIEIRDYLEFEIKVT